MPSSAIVVLAFLAFAVAMVAIWLVTDVIRRVEAKIEGFSRIHIAPIHEKILQTNQAIAKVSKDVEGLAKSVGTVNMMTGRIAKVAEDLNKLDHSIPQRYRVGAVQPEEVGEENGEKVAAKPKK